MQFGVVTYRSKRLLRKQGGSIPNTKGTCSSPNVDGGIPGSLSGNMSSFEAQQRAKLAVKVCHVVFPLRIGGVLCVVLMVSDDVGCCVFGSVFQSQEAFFNADNEFSAMVQTTRPTFPLDPEQQIHPPPHLEESEKFASQDCELSSAVSSLSSSSASSSEC